MVKSLARSSPDNRPHYQSQVFFLFRYHFRRELVDLVVASNSEPKKTSLYRILTEMA